VPPLPPAPFVYPILDIAALGGRTPEAMAAALTEGGARVLQVRGKGVADAVLLDAVRRALPVARARGAVLLVNDRADVALIAGADGVHAGQDDLPPAECRRLLGASAIVGFSTHRIEEVRAAAREPLDYVAFGPVFATATKPDAQPVVGLDGLREARRHTSRPLVAIGGITRDTAAAAVAAGADGVAAISAILSAADVAAEVAALRLAAGERRP
jgi:thiamine-phosphate pyrophosphorylase